MPRIQLIVTGITEEAALRESLMRFFPDKRDRQEVEWLPPRKIEGATTHRLRPGAAPSSPMRKLALALLNEARRGKTGISPDLVIAVDDVEIGNCDQETVIIDHLRLALKAVIGEQKDEPARSEARALLREKCSFHLLCPMVESYFFADRSALAAAGVPLTEQPKLVQADVEQFETNDPAWLPDCLRKNQEKASHSPWWREERHPKHYLDHLTRRGGVMYEETRHGKAALAGIAWEKVPSAPMETRILRSLFEDLASWFDVANPVGTGATHPSLFPEPGADPEDRLLRNL